LEVSILEKASLSITLKTSSKTSLGAEILLLDSWMMMTTTFSLVLTEVLRSSRVKKRNERIHLEMLVLEVALAILEVSKALAAWEALEDLTMMISLEAAEVDSQEVALPLRLQRSSRMVNESQKLRRLTLMIKETRRLR